MSGFVARFYFSTRGRTGRQAYWLLGVVPLVAFASVLGFTAGYFRLSQESVGIMFVLLAPVSIWIWVALGGRRLHDIGASAWWMIAATVIPVVSAAQLPEHLAQLPSLLAMIALGLLPGVVGNNQYGADPRMKKTNDAP